VGVFCGGVAVDVHSTGLSRLGGRSAHRRVAIGYGHGAVSRVALAVDHENPLLDGNFYLADGDTRKLECGNDIRRVRIVVDFHPKLTKR
jgi:hypothetical protein